MAYFEKFCTQNLLFMDGHYLIFSSISPRQDAISRLERAGWNFIIGEDARQFSTDLYNIDLSQILQKEAIYNSIKNKMDEIMRSLYLSHAYLEAGKKYTT